MTDQTDPFAGMPGLLSDAADLLPIIGPPPQAVIDKVMPRLDDQCRAFISASRFCLIATTGADGHIDISPKGDPAGFVRVLSDTMIAIPDRPGNRRIDTFHNLMQNDRIGVLFMVPGKGETLRLRGRARISNDPALLSPMAAKGKTPRLALLIHVDEVFTHCPKCIIRSQLWQPEWWGVANAATETRTLTRDQTKLGRTDEDFEWARKEGFLDLY